MRNIGVFTKKRVEGTLVERLVIGKGGIVESWPASVGRTVVFGDRPDCVYVDTDTSLKNAFFDDESFEKAKAELGFEPQSYIDLHFTSTSCAFDLAENLAKEMQALWDGVIDYDGAGGGIGQPPKSRLRPRDT